MTGAEFLRETSSHRASQRQALGGTFSVGPFEDKRTRVTKPPAEPCRTIVEEKTTRSCSNGLHVLIKVLTVILESGRHEQALLCDITSELSTRLDSEMEALVQFSR